MNSYCTKTHSLEKSSETSAHARVSLQFPSTSDSAHGAAGHARGGRQQPQSGLAVLVRPRGWAAKPLSRSQIGHRSRGVKEGAEVVYCNCKHTHIRTCTKKIKNIFSFRCIAVSHPKSSASRVERENKNIQNIDILYNFLLDCHINELN